ncbi:FAD-dependent oxidoreductase [Lentzea sp. BCCO 10_0856]|uniref:FAD-dependent oxidoreductase n=1 Tax=Lentzea miocenica TaxID=3095431 RepID=A0ABU4ST66_9PSEU|nr:FAD-dependent oxidoreductase [Lentzea sp. BCCO 10_0856]MDX8029084.1 FAD-dependent oxidoreductase [Lentzea sp. BCCO 10_0856]
MVGASAAGLATAEALRRKGYTGPLTILGAEPHLPYDRPPLSKQVLSGTWEPTRARLRSAEALAALDATFVLGDPAVHLDVSERAVHTASGRVFKADDIVLATGLRPRTLSGRPTLRTLDDALALRSQLLSCSQAVVVGDGVLGAEIAATARQLGVPVTLAGPQQAPMALQLGPFVAGLLADLHTSNGVELRLGAAVTGVEDGVRLETGEVLPADLVVVAFGSVPATEWLRDSGLQLDNGVVCDSRCRAADGIYAVGDVARWHHETLGTSLRLENRTNATEQGIAVAGNILGADEPYTPVPYFWTDQFDAKIHVHGFVGPDVSVAEGSVAERRFVAHYHRDGELVGVLGWNMPKQARQHRQSITPSCRATVAASTPGGA